jgi:protein disulfide-isomerase A6
MRETTMIRTGTRLRRIALLFVICFMAATLTKADNSTNDVNDDYSDAPGIIQFTSMEDYVEQVKRGSKVWAIQFYTNDGACEGCKLIHEKYAGLARLLKGLFKFAVVDVTTQHGNDIAHHWGVDHLPSIIIVGDDNKKALATDPEMIVEALLLAASTTIEKRAKNILGLTKEEDILKHFRMPGRGERYSRKNHKSQVTSFVVKANADNFDEVVMETDDVVVVAFARPGCERSKKLYKDYTEAASRLVGESVTVVWVNVNEVPETAKRLDISATPTILVFPGGEKSVEKAYKYDGARTSPDISGAVMREVDKSGQPKEVVQLTSMAILRKYCSGYNHVCVIGALPPLVETGVKGRRKYVAVLERMQTVFRKSTYSFLWFEAGTQPALEKAMHLEYGFPALSTFALDRTAYATMRGSFSDKGISKYLHSVESGIIGVQPILKMFDVATIEPWDGLDAQDDIPMEDEIPLSELMDDGDMGSEDAQDEGVKAECEKDEVEDEVYNVEENEEEEDDDFFRDEL